MAEIVVGAVVTVLIEKLSEELIKFARSEGIDSKLNEWKKKLPLIQGVLADAGQKEITQRAVQRWLLDLQSLAYDIEDVLDDIATEVMKRKLNQEESHANSTSTTSKVMKIILPACCTNNFTPHNFMYGREISSKLDDITTRLHDLFQQKIDLGLNVNIEKSSRTNKPLEETSLVDLSGILGREEDKQALLEKLVGVEASNFHNVKIVSIVGMGGVGKTTLARVLYNDEKVKDHFELRAWVCVSNEFDVFNVSKAIYQAACGENKDFANLDLVHVALKEKLSNKRFLLVLDDVWNEDHGKWNALKQPLVGAPGSKVIVTTRNTDVALVMNSVQTHNLGVLSDDIALSLFAEYALEEKNFDKHPSLSTVARCIVKKCGGLPLALVTLGRVLKAKGNDVVEWEELLHSEIWNSEDESDILPALKLSYYHLPSHLKQVFAYCSMFPKGHQFEKKKLILLWMAQGFLSQPKVNNQSMESYQPMESLGRKYFKELLSRSFFQPLGNGESMYTMHDLMNDLAKSVAGEFFFRLDENMDLNGSNKAYENLCHFSFICQKQVAEYKMFKELHSARRLRTFLSVSDGWLRFKTLDDATAGELLPHLHFLRVLSLTNWPITQVPQSISNLKHLRYLNFSQTDITHLPEEVTKLYNLQSLLVRRCRQLSSLPVSFVKLKNMRHLDNVGTPLLKKMPLGIGGLTSLQTLSKVIIEGGNGFKISELKGLSNLQGELSIEGLEKVIDPTEAKDANLQQKKGLDDLDMKWSNAFDAFRNPSMEYDVLEELRPPSTLKKLSISFFGGIKFPRWLRNPKSFDPLTALTLSGCENCTDLPTLGHLNSLRKLCLSSMNGVKTVGFELLGSTKPFHGNAFPSLESLQVDDMQSLEIWSTNGGDDVETPDQSFRSLLVISISRCPKLCKVSFGLIPSLKDLTVERCPEAVLRDLVGESSSIRRLELEAIEGLTQLDREVLKHLGALEDLRISYCDELRYLWESELDACRFLGSLQRLVVDWCPMLESINVGSSTIKGLTQLDREVLKHLGALEDLRISFCFELRYLWESELDACRFLGSLQRLEVIRCLKLESIIKGEKEVVNLGSSIIMGSLRQVNLHQCDSLESYCCPTSVETLHIYLCSSMTSLSFSKLQEDDLPSSSSNLKILQVVGCDNIKSISQEYWQSLTSLEVMMIEICPSLEDSFPSCGLLWPPNLRELTIGELKKPMSEWGLQNYPPSLVELVLYGENSGVVSFGIMEEQQQHNNNNNTTTSSSCFLLPPSLTKLTIRKFEEVESFSEVLQHLPHLQQLTIINCPKLKDNVPQTTSSLTVNVYE